MRSVGQPASNSVEQNVVKASIEIEDLKYQLLSVQD